MPSTKIELFYFNDNFRHKAQWVPPFSHIFSRETRGTRLENIEQTGVLMHLLLCLNPLISARHGAPISEVLS